MIFGTTSTGEAVHKITLQAADLTVSLLTWGAIVQDVRLADVPRSLTLGSDNMADYEGNLCHHGSLIGPVANRISTSRVLIDGMMYELERNQDGRIHLHSGAKATHRRMWTLTDKDQSSATLRCDLMDGECGLPGNRTITAHYQLGGTSTLTLTIDATTDAPTVMNFANHSYWNFDGTQNWSGHRLKIDADHFLPCTPDDYPTGEIADVTNTQMDFRTLREITVGQDIFDNNFCLSNETVPLRDVLVLEGQSGVGMTMATNQPGLQVYDGRNPARPGRSNFEGLALEAQGWPDAPTQPAFPSIRVTPDTPYHQVTSFTFYTP